MNKITIQNIGNGFVDINFNELNTLFKQSEFITHKNSVSVSFNEDKTVINVQFSNSIFNIDQTILSLIDTTCQTLSEYMIELKTILATN